MFRKSFLPVCVVLAFVALGHAISGQNPPPKTASTEVAPFTGKVLWLDAKPPANGGVIQNARIKRLGERSFLVGDSIQQPDKDGYPPATFWFPIEDIKLIREFRTIEDVLRAEAFMRAAGKE